MKPAFFKTAIQATAICATIALSAGCTVQTVHPLREIGKAVRDDGILGDWQESDPVFGETENVVSISRDDWGRYRIVAGDEDDALGLTGYLIEIDGQHYIELQETSAVDVVNPIPSTSLHSHLFARVQIEENELTVSFPNLNTFKKAITSGELAGIVDNRGFPVTRVILTSPAKELIEFVAANPESAFDDPVIFRRAEQKVRSDE